MTDATKPVPGWYPDPEEPGRYHRYWDGTQWTVRQLLPQAPQPAPAQPVPPPRRLGTGFRVLGQVVGIGLVLVLITTIAQLVTHVWGVRMIDDAAATGDFERLERYDDLTLATSIVLFVLLVVVGVGWMVWQYRLAAAAGPHAVRRTPPWHAWSWWIPIGSLWLPFQNVLDLWRSLLPQRGFAWLRLWWGCWLGANAIAWVLLRSPDPASLGAFKTATTADAVSDVLYLVAAVLAIRVVRTLTSAGLARSSADLTAAASPAA